jgi:hypothetical protein
MSVSGVGTTQNVQSSSSVTPLAEMNLEQLMMFVVFQRMDVNAMQLRQHAAEMDARTQKLEILGRFSQALGKIASQYGSEAKQELKNTDIGKKMSKTDWSAIQAENLTPEQKKAKLDSMSASIDKIDAKFSGNDSGQKLRDTEYGKKYSSSNWNAAGAEFKKVVIDQTQSTIPSSGDEHKQVRENRLNIARTGYELGLLTEDDVTRIGKGDYSKAEFQALKQKIEQYDVNQPSESKNVSSNGKNAEEKARAQDLKDSLENLIKYGRETGLMSETDISRLTKGEFKKSEVEALQASIKTEQDKIGNENTKQQLTLQSITGRLESITNLAGTLTKKIGDIWSAIIQKT